MKKLVAVAVVAALTVAGAVAQVTVGARGNVGLSVGSCDVNPSSTWDTSVIVPYGAGAYVRYNMPFFAPVGVEFDFDFGMNQGLKDNSTNSEDWYTCTYNALDMALLGTYSLDFNAFGITFVAGPYISLPVSKLTYDRYSHIASMTGKKEYDILTSVVYGIKAGVEGSYKVGPGDVVVGLSYVNDFNSIDVEPKYYSFTRRNLNLSVGYAIQF